MVSELLKIYQKQLNSKPSILLAIVKIKQLRHKD